jgi:predicted RNase H-like nuclease
MSPSKQSKQDPKPEWTLVGVDCALDEQRLGLARGRLDAEGKLRIERVTLGTAGESAAASVSSWISGQGQFVIALDAPLGWPQPLAASLLQHQAGEKLDAARDELFRRQTDRELRKALGRWPPEVGADRIARTGLAALELLSEIRALAERPVPLAWKQAVDSGAIEVYPAATLLARGLSGAGYKAKTSAGRKARSELLQRLAAELTLDVAEALLIEDPNQFDALLCVLASADFARGMCVDPTDRALAKREGFIWFRSSGQGLLPYAVEASGED